MLAIIPAPRIENLDLIKKLFKKTDINNDIQYIALMLAVKFCKDSPTEKIENCRGNKKIISDVKKAFDASGIEITVRYDDKFFIPQNETYEKTKEVNGKPFATKTEAWIFESSGNIKQVVQAIQLFEDIIKKGIHENRYWVVEIV